MFVEDQVTPSPSQVTYTKLLREKIEEVLESLPLTGSTDPPAAVWVG